MSARAGEALNLPHTRALDGLRGLAIALVYAYHVEFLVRTGGGVDADFRGVDVSSLVAPLRAGNTGVSLFFVLSGFLLGRPFWLEAAGGPRVDRGRYLLRRVLRIMPLYTVAVLVGAAWYADRPADLLRAVPWLLFLSPLGLTTDFPGISGVWWSLATEAQFYLLLPALPLLLRRRHWPLAAGVYVLIYAAFVLGYLTPWLGSPEKAVSRLAVISLSVLGRSPLLFIGMVASWMYARYGQLTRTRWAGLGWPGVVVADLVVVALVVALAHLLRWALAQGLVLVELPPSVAWHVPEGGLWAAILLMILVSPGRLGRLVASAPLVGLGLISYSVYLLHYPILEFSIRWLERAHPRLLASSLGTVAVVSALTLACVGASMLTYATIERPPMRWRQVGRD